MSNDTHERFWARCTIERVEAAEVTLEPADEARTEAETEWYLRGLRRGRLLGIVDAADAIHGRLGDVTLDMLLRDNVARDMRDAKKS